MFENIIEQGAVHQLREDILRACNAPSMLFFGPGESGKGSAALELARVLSCSEEGDWKCSCSSCIQHRYLKHNDLLALGHRSFSSEIAASSSTFLRNPGHLSSKLLFFRSVRKLMLRFSPVLMEDDPKFSKILSLLVSLDDGLNEYLDSGQFEKTSLEKLCSSIVKNANALESEGLGKLIPIGHIRSASYWCRLAPESRRKTLIIENAENMRDEARNSLLKLLEEPPPAVNIVLTAKRREAIMPTILSRLRPYRFLKRDAESEKEVIRRVFQDEGSGLSEYLDAFLPQSTEKLYPLAAWFIVSLARISSMSKKRRGQENIPEIFRLLGERYAQIAQDAGFQRCLKDADVIKTVISKSGNFENASFSRFMKICLDLTSDVTRTSADPDFIACNDIFRKHVKEAVNAVDVLNINASVTLEALFYKLKNDLRRQYD
ncbi:MAG: DNA polymerase III [Treponema sp.]|nr:DNA polymerase III [Treponema sp.]